MQNVRHEIGQEITSQYQGMRKSLVAETQASVQASVQALFKQYLGNLQPQTARPQVLAALGTPPKTQHPGAVARDTQPLQTQEPVFLAPREPRVSRTA